MRRKACMVVSTVALLGLSCAFSRAQQTPVRKIYVREVAQSATPSDDARKIAEAATSILGLRLHAMKQLKVVRGEVQCDSTGARPAFEQRQESAQMPIGDQAPSIYEVKTSIRTLAATDGVNNNPSELVLEYDLMKYFRCKPSSIVHRSEPISLKTAFEGLMQMGDVIEVALTEDLASPKAVIDVADITAIGDSMQQVKEDLANMILIRLVQQPDFEVRNFRGKPPDSRSDYIVTGELITKEQKGAKFTVKSVKDNKTDSFKVPGPIGQKNADEKALAAFYEKSASMVVNYIRSVRDNVGPLSDADVEEIYQRALKLLCKEQTSSGGCAPQSVTVIPMLTRVREAEKASPKTLELLGDAYTEVEEYDKAASAYDQAWSSLPVNVADAEVVRLTREAGDALYKAHNYRSAADRYRRAIEISAKHKFPVTDSLFLQYTRSYGFAGDRMAALSTALQGLVQFPYSSELNEEVDGIVTNLQDDELQAAYQLLIGYKSPGKTTKDLEDVRRRLAEFLIDDSLDDVLDRKFEQANKKLETVEGLSLSVLPIQSQKRYKIIRALWSVEARNEFDAPIATLSLMGEEDSEEGKQARIFLAYILISRAKAAGASSNRADYVKAADLLKSLLEKDSYSGLYSMLLAANHELGKDQESREFIEGKLKANRNPSALQGLAKLCIDYVGDLECGAQVIKELDTSIMSTWSLRLIAIRLHLLRGDYQELVKLMGGPVVPPPPSDVQMTLNAFYQVWYSVAQNRETDAAASMRDWLALMEKFRASGQRTYWALDTAKQGIEADQHIPTNRKDVLRRMIANMLDSRAPLPKVTDFFASSKKP